MSGKLSYLGLLNAIAVGEEIDEAEISAIGHSGTFASKSRGDIAVGFDQIAERIEGFSRRYYLLSYCSPSRAGEHTVEVEAIKDGAKGRLEYHFDARGFRPNCNPNQKPTFNVHRPRMRSQSAHERGDN